MDKGGATPDAQISAVAALNEPIRRRLYDYVVRQPDPVSRDQAAATSPWPHPSLGIGVGIPQCSGGRYRRLLRRRPGEIHADSKGWRLNVFEQGDLLYKQTGPTHFGMAEPASWALMSLQQCMATLLFSTDDISPMEILGLKALQHLIDDAVKTFDRAEMRVEETDKRVLKWPPWKRRLWVLWKSILVNPE